MCQRPLCVVFAVMVSMCMLLSAPWAGAQGVNLVMNGSFEEDADGDGRPDGWSTAGRREVLQELALDTGREGGKSARLTCTAFEGGTPDSHAMICQVGTVGVKRGQWYRLSFWTKGRDLARSSCQVALSNTRPWGASGVEATFPVGFSWTRVERVCRATADVPAETSRLQFWFASTGTLWLDDVVLEPIELKVEFHPRIAVEGVGNPVPNSSFEAGTMGWGSYAPNLRTWTGNVYSQLGEIDDTTAYHGRQSLRLSLSADRTPVYYFDYFDPVEEPIRTLLAAHVGWIPLKPGMPYVLSCALKADRPDVPAVLLIHQSSGGEIRHAVRTGTEWQRFSFTFKPLSEFVWTGVGMDLSAARLDGATLWVDAVQVEPGETTMEYVPRAEVESFIETPATGNVFLAPDEGLTVDLSAANTGDQPRTVKGRLVIKDFFDKEVLTVPVEKEVAAGSTDRVRLTDLLRGWRGFFRVHWECEDPNAPYPQSLRCALIDPYEERDSAFGMNHAYGWSFLLKLSKAAGLTWMRDWSIKWNTVEPQQGSFDFSKVDPQIDRVLAEGLNVLALLPFPSAPWCSQADKEVIRQVVGEDKAGYLQYTVAWRPRDDALFRNYVARSVDHYKNRTTHYEILNEPLYTTYAVPARFGYGMKDYLDLLRIAYEAVKSQQLEAQVLGGLGAWVDSSWVRRFVNDGGLKWCDIMDIHLYPVTIPPEMYEQDLASVWETMQARGEAKPIWLTEFGCYADDDPYMTPSTIGDAAMSRAHWPTERAAAEALVKSSACFLSHGVSKIFFHAGTCGPINGADGGGIFFEYGGAPRKMYAALSALANLLGEDFRALPLTVVTDRLRGYLFGTSRGVVAVVWAVGEEPVSLVLPASVGALDLMGNPVQQAAARVTSMPVYLTGQDGGALRDLLERAK